MNEVKKVGKSNTRLLAFSMTFFVIVIVLTVGLFIYSGSVAKTNQKNVDKVSELAQRINEIKMDKKVQIYGLLEKNGALIKRKELLSDIPSFVGEMHKIATEYSLSFSGFDYSDGIVLSLTQTETDNTNLAYKRASTFIREYRKGADNLYNVLFVNAVTGTNSIKFNVDLEVK